MIILASAFALTVAIIAHWVAGRFFVHMGAIFRYGILAVVVGALLFIALYSTRPISDVINGLLIYFFGCELYLFLITLCFASISANILARLKSGPALIAELNDRYSGATMSSLRVQRIQQSNLARKKNRILSLTTKGRIVVIIAKALRWLFGHDGYVPTRNKQRLLSYCAAIVLFVAMFVPCVSLVLTGAAPALFEEAIGYRYFYSLRVLFGQERPWVPQGHTLGLVQHVLQLLLSGLGFSLDDTSLRIGVFVVLNGAIWCGITAWLLYKLCRELPDAGIGVMLTASLYFFANAPSAEFIWYAYPDYPTVTMAIAAATVLWSWRLISNPKALRLTRGEIVSLGIFAGFAVGNKITNVVYPVTIGALYLLRNLRNVGGIIGSAVIAVAWFQVVLDAYYLHTGMFLPFVEGLKVFIQSQSHEVAAFQLFSFAGTLFTDHISDGLFLLPSFILVATSAAILDRRLLATTAFIPGAAFLCYFIFQRFYSWSIIEAYLFAWTAWSIFVLLIIKVTALRWPTHSVPALAFVFFCLAAGFLFPAVSRIGTLYSKYDLSYRQLTSDLLGKRVLALVPGNTYRIVSTFSSICKGGMDIFTPKWGVSRFISSLFPNFACEVVPYAHADLRGNDVIIFRQLDPDTREEAVNRIEKYFTLDLRQFDCRHSLQVPGGAFVACFHL